MLLRLHIGAFLLRPVVELLLHQRRQHPAGTDRVHRHAIIGQLDRRHLGHADHAVLGRDIGDLLRARHQARAPRRC